MFHCTHRRDTPCGCPLHLPSMTERNDGYYLQERYRSALYRFAIRKYELKSIAI